MEDGFSAPSRCRFSGLTVDPVRRRGLHDRADDGTQWRRLGSSSCRAAAGHWPTFLIYALFPAPLDSLSGFYPGRGSRG